MQDHVRRSTTAGRSGWSLFAFSAPSRIAMLAVLVCLAAVASGQDAPPAHSPPADIDQPALAARVAELTDQETRNEISAAGAQELALLRDTQKYLNDGAAAVSRANEFSSKAQSAPSTLAEIEDYLKKPVDQLISDRLNELKPADATLEELIAMANAARGRKESEDAMRLTVDSDEQERAIRRAAIPLERGAATERLDSLTGELTAVVSTDAEEVAKARKWKALAEQYFQQATIRALDEELRNYDARRALLDKRRSFRDQKIAVEAGIIAKLDERISALQLAAAKQAADEAEKKRIEAINAHPVVKAILDENQAHAARNTVVVGDKNSDVDKLAAAEAQLRNWSAAFDKSKGRVERVGLTNAIGQHLRNQLSRLPDTSAIRREMADRDARFGGLVNEAEDVAQLESELADIDSIVQQRMDDAAESLPEDPVEREAIRSAVKEALLAQRGYLKTLGDSINGQFDTPLLQLQNTQRELRAVIEQYKDYIDERILWIRSAEYLGPADIAASGRAIAWMLDGDNWARVGSASWQDIRANPAVYGLYVSLLTVLLLIQRRLRRRLAEIAEKTRRFTTDRFALTVVALVISVLMAAAAPAIMAFAAWRLSVAAAGDPFGEGLSNGLYLAAELLFDTEFIRILCRRSGVGEAHFRWKPATLRFIRQQLRWLVPIAVPLMFIVEFTASNDNHHDSLGRLAFIALMIAFAIFLLRFLKPSTGVLRNYLSRHRGGWTDRLKYVWFPLFVLTPLASALIAGLGYFYSAVQLEQRLLDTVWLLLLVVVGRALLLRSLFLAQRRLDIEQRRKKRQASAAAAAAEKAALVAGTPSSTAPASSSEPISEKLAQSVPEAEHIDVAAVSAQTRQLLNAAVVLTVSIGLALVWFDVMPALGFFQQVELWPGSEAVAAQTDGGNVLTNTLTGNGSQSADAEPAVTESPQTDAVTLGDLMYAMIILVVMAMVSKNIPGLLEIMLLQRLPISPSARYAVTTIARYALIIIGVVLAFGAIGIGWSKVQWLAAAITVGLGFGLQEIFANFVSGLIILFERPVRVGDTVTVGGVSGTVARLRIRATTITDWDRKELIIPNKEFVTGQIINWTLTDPILRLVVPVGIAYGSDTKLAEELLLKVAKDEPAVLADPPPTVLFSAFADSSLTFNLRVFIPHIDALIMVRHRLHNAIDQAFRDANIVIAFPQRDVHVISHPAAPESKENDVKAS